MMQHMNGANGYSGSGVVNDPNVYNGLPPWALPITSSLAAGKKA